MAKEYRCPGAGEGGGTQLEARRNSRGRPWWTSRAVVLVALALQTAWRQFMRKNRTIASVEDIWRFAGELMMRFGVNGPFEPYSCDEQ